MLSNPNANLVISCPDLSGIVMEITQFLFSHGANISTLEQHIEDGMFFMRVEWEKKQFSIASETEFLEKFLPLQQKFGMEISLDFCERKKEIGIFCSKEGHCLVDILGRVAIAELPIKIPYIISNSEELQKIAHNFGIPFHFFPTNTGENFEKKQLEIIHAHQTDAICLARYMKILSADFISQAGQKIINVHHSFLPSFIGAKPYHDAFERGVKLIGATAHFVIPELDQGPIIEQRVQRISHTQDIEKLKLMGRESEKEAFAFAIRKQVENKLIIFKNRVIVFE